MEQVKNYYCITCGYVGNTPGICPECGGEMIADDVSLPHENEEEERYDEELLEDEEEVVGKDKND